MIAKNVNDIINKRKVPLTVIASILNISRMALYRKLSGKSSFKAEEIEKIALFLNVPISEFFKDKTNYGLQ